MGDLAWRMTTGYIHPKFIKHRPRPLQFAKGPGVGVRSHSTNCHKIHPEMAGNRRTELQNSYQDQMSTYFLYRETQMKSRRRAAWLSRGRKGNCWDRCLIRILIKLSYDPPEHLPKHRQEAPRRAPEGSQEVCDQNMVDVGVKFARRVLKVYLG